MKGTEIEINKALDATFVIGYQQGINDTVDILMNFFPDEPCNYNGLDELSDCEYCEQHCGNNNVKECWENAIKNRWDLKTKENSND